MIDSLVTLKDVIDYSGISILVVLIMFLCRKRIAIVIFFVLFLTFNIRTFIGIAPFEHEIMRIIGFERWVVFCGLILLGFVAPRSIHTEHYKTINIFYSIYVLMIFISLSYSLYPLITFQRGIAMILLYGATFYGLYNCIDSYRTMHQVCKAIVIVTLVINIIPWFFNKYAPHMFVYVQVLRYRGIFGEPTWIAAVNIFTYPLTLSICHISKRKINFMIILFLMYFIFISYSRTAFIALVIGTFFYYLQYYRKKKGYVILTFAILIIITALLFLNLLDTDLIKDVVRLDTLSTIGDRIVAWKVAMPIIFQRPWSGFGFGVEELLYRHFRSFPLLPKEPYLFGPYFHSSFLGFAAQLGIPFAIFYFTGLLLYFLFSIKFTAGMNNGDMRVLAIGLNTVIMCGLLYCFSESFIYSPGNAFNFVYFIICAMFLKLIALYNG